PPVGRRPTATYVYTLNRPSRANPISVIPVSLASSTASDEGAPTATTHAIPATAAFCTISNPPRPLTTRITSSNDRDSSTNAPITLSTALCRPTSSATTSGSPAAENNPAA